MSMTHGKTICEIFMQEKPMTEKHMNPQYEAHERLCKSIGDMTKENEKLKDRIKWLEEARTQAAVNSFDNMLSYEDAINKIRLLQEAGDDLAKIVERDYVTTGFTEPWRKAKEAKP